VRPPRQDAVVGPPGVPWEDLESGPSGDRVHVIDYDATTRTMYSPATLGEPRSWLLWVDCDPNGGMEIDRDFFVDFYDRPEAPARAREVRFQNGDGTTEIF
jgi:hypothetical protein